MVGTTTKIDPTRDTETCLEWLVSHTPRAVVSITDIGESGFTRYITYQEGDWWYTTATTREVNLTKNGWQRRHVASLIDDAWEREALRIKQAPFGYLVRHCPSPTA